MVICLERGADLHMAQLMPLPLTVSCSSKIQIGFTFLVPAYPGYPGKEAVKWLLNGCCSVKKRHFTEMSLGTGQWMWPALEPAGRNLSHAPMRAKPSVTVATC